MPECQELSFVDAQEHAWDIALLLITQDQEISRKKRDAAEESNDPQSKT